MCVQMPKEVEKAEEYVYPKCFKILKNSKGYFRIPLVHEEDLAEEAILETRRSFNVAPNS